MTQEEISNILEPIRIEYEEVFKQFSKIKEGDFMNVEHFKIKRENLLGQCKVYQNVLMQLQDIQMKIALEEVKG